MTRQFNIKCTTQQCQREWDRLPTQLHFLLPGRDDQMGFPAFKYASNALIDLAMIRTVSKDSPYEALMFILAEAIALGESVGMHATNHSGRHEAQNGVG